MPEDVLEMLMNNLSNTVFILNDLLLFLQCEKHILPIPHTSRFVEEGTIKIPIEGIIYKTAKNNVACI